MRNSVKAKTTSFVVLFISVFLLSALAGVQFVGKVSATYTEYTGSLGGGGFIVRFPDNWNGMLVVICRGYSYSGNSVPAATVSPNGATMLDQGFAVAASNYGAAGFCVQKGMNSTYELTKYIISTYHVTGKVFLDGQSMGGCIALLLGEKYPSLYSGVLDLFGAKDLKDTYTTMARWANLSDPDLTAELISLTAPVPILGFSLQALRDFCAGVVLDIKLETGGTPTTKPTAYKDDSPTYHANITIPVITVHGTSDALVPFYQTIMYQTAVANAGRSNLYRLYNVTGGQHMEPSIYAQAPARLAELVSWSSTLQDWTMTVDGRGMKAYPDLREYIWQKTPATPPNGQYDKIVLHRLVKTGITPKGVLFICPRVGWSGEQWISNPPTDNYTKTENNSQPIYWANRGFDVYAIDYRTHFVPSTLNNSQLAFMQNWTYTLWMSDIKEAVDKTKEVSGASKVFMAGPSNGGGATMMYASKYWKEDLRGIILLDALIYNGKAAIAAKNETGTNTYNLTKTVSDMITAATWSTSNYVNPNRTKYALANPGAPAEDPPGTPLTPLINPLTNKTWTNITEWFTYTIQNAGTSNVYEGYGNVTEVMTHLISADPFTARRMTLEGEAMADWTNCPYVPYDFDDHFNEINVPLLAFASGPLYSNKTGTFRFINGINNTDFTGIMLPKYGHTDVYMGTYSARDVSEPAYQWLLSHLSTLDVSAFQSVTVLPGWTWNFFAHNKGGATPYAYQWYEGLNPIQGQTSMVLPISKTAPGVYSFYCRVTDKDGTTTTSNAVTLTVMG